MPAPGHQTVFATGARKLNPKESSQIPMRPIELFELEVGESDFSELRRDQALLVDFHDFANSLISLLHVCELGDMNVSQPSEQNMPFENNHKLSTGRPTGSKNKASENVRENFQSLVENNLEQLQKGN